MEKLHKERLDAMQKELDDKIVVFRGLSSFTVTKLKRWDYGGVFRRAVTAPNCGFEKNSKDMEKRVKLLVDAYDKHVKKIDSKLKLD